MAVLSSHVGYLRGWCLSTKAQSTRDARYQARIYHWNDLRQQPPPPSHVRDWPKARFSTTRHIYSLALSVAGGWGIARSFVLRGEYRPTHDLMKRVIFQHDLCVRALKIGENACSVTYIWY